MSVCLLSGGAVQEQCQSQPNKKHSAGWVGCLVREGDEDRKKEKAEIDCS